MTLNQTAALAADVTFQGQVRAAGLAQALTVIGSVPTNKNLIDEKRWALAQSTIKDGCFANLQLFAWGIAATPGFSGIVSDTNDANDAAVNSAMVSQWSNLAGVTGADSNSIQVGV